MGKRGPAPKPTAIKKLQGNAGRRELNEDEPKYDTPKVLPDPPDALVGDKYARKEWKVLGEILLKVGVLTEGDYNALTVYCKLYSRWYQAEQKIREKGLTTLSAMGGEVVRPEVKIAQDTAKLMKEYLKEFGLTPASRSAIKAVGVSEKDTDDPFLQMIKGGA